MLFFKNTFLPLIIEDIPKEELSKFLKEKGLGFEIIDPPTLWGAFAHYYASKLGFNIVKSTSFAYMVSLFLGGMGISAGTEMYFKEEEIEHNLIEYYLNTLQAVSDEEKAILLFDEIVDIYQNRISNFEFATEKLNFRVTPSELEKFNSIEGKSNKERFIKLLDLL